MVGCSIVMTSPVSATKYVYIYIHMYVYVYIRMRSRYVVYICIYTQRMAYPLNWCKFGVELRDQLLIATIVDVPPFRPIYVDATADGDNLA